MKKLFFTLAIALGALSVSAQEVGSMWVGGSVGFSYSKTKGLDSNTSYKILPEFGYVVQDNLALGISLGYADLEGHQLNGDKVNLESYIVNPFVRYSFLKGPMGALFVDAGVGYAHTKAASLKGDNFEVGFRPGVALQLSEKISLTGKFGMLGYQYEKLGSSKTNTFGFDFDLSNILIGASFHF